MALRSTTNGGLDIIIMNQNMVLSGMSIGAAHKVRHAILDQF